MALMDLDGGVLVPMMVFAIPIVAIVGVVSTAIVRTIGQQRTLEMAQRERIAAIERGVDPAKLPPIPTASLGSDLGTMYLSPYEFQRRRSMNLLIGGVVTLSVGVGLCGFLYFVDRGDSAWACGLVPATIGIGLLLSAWLVRPQGTEPTASSL